MSFKLRTATVDDIEAMCGVYLSAFEDEILSRQIFPRSSDASLDYWRKTLTEEFNEECATFLVVVTEASPSGQSPETVIGFVKWVAPGAPFHDFDEDGYPEDGNPAIAAEYYEKVFAGHRRNMGDMPHWYLDIIGVRQEWMGKGASRLLMEWGFEKAKTEGKPCFVESTEPAKSFYEKFGFREMDRMTVDTPEGEAAVFFMIGDM